MDLYNLDFSQILYFLDLDVVVLLIVSIVTKSWQGHRHVFVTCVWEKYSSETSLHSHTVCTVDTPVALPSYADRADEENPPAAQNQTPRPSRPEMLHTNVYKRERLL